jgi:hypothetical protein
MHASTTLQMGTTAMTLGATTRRLLTCVLPCLVPVLAPSAAAQPMACPAPGALVQVGSCLPPAELRAAYIGYCSDNRRLYSGDTDTCSSFENFVRAKHSALWESADGAFQGYLSCALPADAVARLPPPALSIARQGTVTRVLCRYGETATVAHRTKARCTLHDAAACAADPSACRARCD